MPSLRELWRISGYFYRDVAFRSIYEMGTHRNPEKVVRSARISMLINKVILAFILSAMAVYTAFRLNVLDFVIFYVMVTFLLAFFFLQTTTTFTSQKFDLLFTLPLSGDEISKVISLTFFRIFDIPILAVAVVFPIAMIVKSPVYSIPAFVGLLVSESFAIALVVYLTRLFYSKIVCSTGWKSLIRLLYYLIWAFTFFAFYAFASLMGRLYTFAETYSTFVTSSGRILSFLFPFCFAFLSSGSFLPNAFIGSVLWSFIAYLSIRWAVSNVRDIFARFEWKTEDVELNIRISSPIVAFLRKDFKLISRSPAHCFLVLLPIMEGLLLSHGRILHALSVVLAFLVIVAYSMYGLEREGIVRILPVRTRTVILAKTLLTITVYAISITVIDVVFILRGKIPDFPLEVSMVPSVFAMSVIVLSIAEKIGARRDVYTGLGSLVFLMIPGVIIVYSPIVIAFIFKIFYGVFLPVLVAVSVIEFLTALILLNVI